MGGRRLLFPINHGVVHYPGFDVLPPFVVYRTLQVDTARYAEVTGALGTRLRGLFTDEPIPYRMQNGGDYAIPWLDLKPALEGSGQYGLRLHLRPAGAPVRDAVRRSDEVMPYSLPPTFGHA